MDTEKEALGAAADMVAALQGVVEGLQMNLSRLRDENEGLSLSLESLKEENEKLRAAALSQPAEGDATADERMKALEAKLSFYYRDMKKIDPHEITAEDGETLFNILEYTFRALKKAGLKL